VELTDVNGTRRPEIESLSESAGCSAVETFLR
jgi:hypothetical protein